MTQIGGGDWMLSIGCQLSGEKLRVLCWSVWADLDGDWGAGLGNVGYVRGTLPAQNIGFVNLDVRTMVSPTL